MKKEINFIDFLSLSDSLKKKIFLDKPQLIKDSLGNEVYLITLRSLEKINSNEFCELVGSLKGIEFEGQKLNIYNFKLIQNPKHFYSENISIEVYSFLNAFFKNYLKEIDLKNIFLKEGNKDKLIEIIVSDSKTFNEISNNLKEIKYLISNFDIAKDIMIRVKQSGKFFQKNYSIKDIEIKKKSEPINLEKNKSFLNGYKLLDSKEKENRKKIYFIGKIFNLKPITFNHKLISIEFFVEKNNEVIIFKHKNLSKNKNNDFKIGDKIIIYGDWEYDKYSRDFILKSDFVENFNYEEKIKIEKTRHEFHIHTKMSSMDGVGEVSEYFKIAEKLNIKTLAFTDHDSVQSFPEISKYAKKYKNIKTIYGVEMNFINEGKTNFVINPKPHFLLDAEYTFFDLETTGISPFVNEIIEFGAVKVKKGKVIERKQIFIKPIKKIPNIITEITGIRNKDLEESKNIKEVLPEIIDFLGDSILVAHNAQFDYSFLNSFYKRNGFGELKNTIIDTLKISWLLNEKIKNHKLGTIAKKQEIIYEDGESHRADYDAEILYKIFENFIPGLFKLNIRNIEDFKKHEIKIKNKIFSNHINILAKNNDGIKDIYELVSISHTTGFNKKNKKPSIKINEILKKRENLLLGSSCSNGVLWESVLNDYNDIEKIFKMFDYIEVFPPTAYNFLVEDKKFSLEDIKKIIKKIIDLSYEYGIPVIFSSNAHYVEPKDKIIRDVYISNKGLGGVIHPLFRRKGNKILNSYNHLRTYSELREETLDFIPEKMFEEINEKNSLQILNKISNDLKPLKEKLYTPFIEGSREKLLKIIEENLEFYYGKNPNILIQERFNKEKEAIFKHGFDIIYYLSYISVKKSLEEGYVVGSRGSVGSSIVAFFSKITDVNPLPPHYICLKCKFHVFVENVSSGYDLEDKDCPNCKSKMFFDGHNIPFETFLGFNFDKVPDIDLNFSREFQTEIHLFIKEFLGEENVFKAGTISTVAEKTAFGYLKNYCEFKQTNFDYATNNYLIKKITGTKRTTGQHPGGLIVLPKNKNIYEFTPINYPGNDLESNWKTTHFDFHSIHDNLLKLDFLGHLDPSSLKMLKDLSGFEPSKIPMNDKKVLSLFSSNKSLGYVKNETGEELGIIGIPEFGTKFVRGLVKKAKPKTFSDLIRISGLSHGTNVWTGNAKQLIEKKQATLKEVISVRDDIMVYLISKGLKNETSFKIMESIRKGKGLTSEWENKMIEHGVPSWYIESAKKIEYMFPKAHATAYVIMAYKISWYKINFPLEYYATFFSIRDTQWELESLYKGIEGIKKFQENFKNKKKEEITEKDKVVIETYEIAMEFLSRGYKFEKISLEKSHYKNWLIDSKNKSLIPPFLIIDGLGETIAKNIYYSRKEKIFTNLEDFQKRSNLNKTLFLKFKELKIFKNLKSEIIKKKQLKIEDFF